MASENGVVITQREVYDELVSVRGEIGHLSSELKGIRGDLKSVLDTGKDHETRIRSLEIKVWSFAGGTVVLSLLGSATVTAVLKTMLGG